MQFFLLRDGNQEGPFTLLQIREMWKVGQITSEDLFWQEGLSDWQPISTIQAEIENTSKSISPPKPPPATKAAKQKLTKKRGCFRSGLVLIGLFFALSIIVGLFGSKQPSSTASVPLPISQASPQKVSEEKTSPTKEIEQAPNRKEPIPTAYDELQTTDGVTYKNCKVTKVELNGITIIYSDGAAKIPFEKLPTDIQQRYNYDPVAAKKAEEQARTEAEKKKAGEEAEARSKKELDQFVKVLETIDRNGAWADSVAVEKDRLIIKVKSSWHYQPYQIRLQAAQNLWKLWAQIHSPQTPDRARLRIMDMNDNEVGGSRVWAGSTIWVKE